MNRERTTNAASLTIKDYVDKIKEVCAEMGIPVIDFYSNVCLHPDIQEWNDTYFYLNQGHGDGLHPNKLGSQIMGAYFGTKLNEYLDRHR
jgi:lysophospholipase L1-like esterase